MKDKLAVQMFTLRDFTTTWEDFTETVQRVSNMGYPAVQISAIGCMDRAPVETEAVQAMQILEDHNLQCVGTHRPWDSLVENIEEEIAFHKALRCDYCAIGSIPKDLYDNSYDGYRRWLDDARPIIEKLKAEGIRFGHHNHSREFYQPQRHGKTLEDILIDEGGQDLMMELDLYWVAHAGVSPERLVKRCTGRVPLIHIKDKEPLPDSHDCRIAAVGEGVMEWKHIIPACEAAGVDWYTVEQDTCPRDPFDCLQSSIDYLTGNDWG